MKRTFRYLSGTKAYQLTYGAESNDLIGYTDADGANQEHRHAISGNVFLIDGGAVLSPALGNGFGNTRWTEVSSGNRPNSTYRLSLSRSVASF